MNHRQYDTLTINGNTLQGDAIADYCVLSNRDDLLQVGLFVRDWLKEEPSIEIRTSGSTGNPKIISVGKDQMLASAAMTAKYFDFKHGQTALLCLPVHYIAGKMMVVRALYSGLDLWCIPPDRNPLASLPGNMTIDFAPLIPMQLNDVTDSASIKNILLGGAPIDPLLERKLQSYSPNVFHGYGMTETLSHVAVRRVNGKERSDEYHALNGIRFEKDDRECLIIHVPFLMHPVLTNDVVELLSETSFNWKGRIDFVVNSGGVKLYPEEIEKKIAQFIDQRFFLAGLPDERFGEKLCLFIEGDVYEEEQLSELEQNIYRQLDRFENPKEIFFVENFVTTSSGKINRNSTRDLLG